MLQLRYVTFLGRSEDAVPGRQELNNHNNMAAEGGVSPRCSDSEQEKLGRSAKNQQKYGTATRTPCLAATPDLFVKHWVRKDETLPGIALKYGRSVG